MEFTELIEQVAKRTIEIEQQALSRLSSSINDSFIAGVELVYNSTGRLIVTGIGKTAIVAQKLVATLNSTGTPAIFLHAADAIHGDIGMILPDDIVLCISKSGETAEIKVLASLVHQLGNPLIAMVSRSESTLGRRANYIFLTPVDQEADPNNLAPTTSTTVQMAMGDAMATALLAMRGFSSNDFALFHPGGALGKQLYLKVDELAERNQVPKVLPSASLREVILEMTTKCLGATAVVNAQNGILLGVITDGDLRRMLRQQTKVDHLTAQDIMTSSPHKIEQGVLAVKALEKMRSHSISQLPICDSEGRYLGMIHLHDLVKEGLL